MHVRLSGDLLSHLTMGQALDPVGAGRQHEFDDDEEQIRVVAVHA